MIFRVKRYLPDAEVVFERLGAPTGRSTRRETICDPMQAGSIDTRRPVIATREPVRTPLGAEIVSRRPSCP